MAQNESGVYTDAVEIEIPEGIMPSGVEDIDKNGDYDVFDKAGVKVRVPQGVFPSGVEDIDKNGDYDVTDKEGVKVRVPQGVFPSGIEDIDANGYYDVTGKEGVRVAVPEHDDGGWGREIGAPNLDLLRLPGRECASGSGNHVLFLSYYQDKVMPTDIKPRINDKSRLVSVQDVTINADGTYAVNDTITFDNNGFFSKIVNTAGWHVLRFEFDTSATSLTFYTSTGNYQLQQVVYEVVECGLDFVFSVGSAAVSVCIVDAVFGSSLSQAFMNKYSLRNVVFVNCDTSNVTNLSNMFNGCYSLRHLDLSSFDTSNVTNLSNMFNGCYSLRHLDLSSFDTSNVTTMQNMFSRCDTLAELDLSSFNMGRMTTISQNQSFMLQKVIFPDGETHQFPVTGEAQKTWTANPDTAIVSMSYLFGESGALEHIVNFPVIHCSFTLNKSLLTVASLLTVFNALPEVETSQTVTIGGVNIAKLTEDQLAIAQDKGWTVA